MPNSDDFSITAASLYTFHSRIAVLNIQGTKKSSTSANSMIKPFKIDQKIRPITFVPCAGNQGLVGWYNAGSATLEMTTNQQIVDNATIRACLIYILAELYNGE